MRLRTASGRSCARYKLGTSVRGIRGLDRALLATRSGVSSASDGATSFSRHHPILPNPLDFDRRNPQSIAITASPTRISPPWTIRARSPPRFRKYVSTSRPVLLAKRLHGSHNSMPSSMAAPTWNRLPQRSLSATPRVTKFRRGISGVNGHLTVRAKAWIFSLSINVSW